MDNCVSKIVEAVKRETGADWSPADAHQFMLDMFEIMTREGNLDMRENLTEIIMGNVGALPDMDIRALSSLDKYKFYNKIKESVYSDRVSNAYDALQTGNAAQQAIGAIMQMMDVGLYPGAHKGRFVKKDMTARDALFSIMGGSYSGRPFSRHSVSVIREGIERMNQVYVNKLLATDRFSEIRKAAQWGGVPGYGAMKGYNKLLMDFSSDVVDELAGIIDYKSGKGIEKTTTGNKLAKEFADALRLTSDTQAVLQKEFGVDLRLKKGFVPNALDAQKISKMSVEDFTTLMMDKLDWEKSFLPEDGKPVMHRNAEAKLDILERAYDSIVKRDQSHPKSGYRVQSDVMRRMTHSQEFVFKDGKSWMEVHSKVGQNDNIISVFDYRNQLNARMFSMAKMFGSKPEVGFDIIRKELIRMLESGELKSRNLERDLRQLEAANLFHDPSEVNVGRAKRNAKVARLRRELDEMVEKGRKRQEQIDEMVASDDGDPNIFDKLVKERKGFRSLERTLSEELAEAEADLASYNDHRIEVDPVTGDEAKIYTNPQEIGLEEKGGRRKVHDYKEKLIGDRGKEFVDGVHAALRGEVSPNWKNMFDETKSAFKEVFAPEDGGLRMMFSEAAGETLHPLDPNATRIWSISRQLKSQAVLGKVLLSSITDPGNVAFSLVQKGATWHEAYKDLTYELFDNRFAKTGDSENIAHGFVAFYDDLIGSMHGRFSFMEQGTVPRMSETFFRMTGLQQWTDMMRGAAARANMRWLGRHAGSEFGMLPPGLKLALQSHGINHAKWDFFRKNCTTVINGKKYMLPDRLDLNVHDHYHNPVPDHVIENVSRKHSELYSDIDGRMPNSMKEALQSQSESVKGNPARMRAQLLMDMWGFVNDEAKTGVIEVDDRTRYYLLRGTRPGTLSGEILRFMAMFKTFPVGVAGRMIHRGMNFAPGESRFSAFKPVAQYIALSTAIGYMSLALSDIASGYAPRTPHDFNTTLSTLQAAVVKGGGLGIYADITTSLIDNNSKKALSTVFGPILGGTVPDAVDIMKSAIVSGDRTGAKMFKFFLNNVPGGNFMFARAALDATINREIYSWLDPGRSARVKWYNEEKLGRVGYLPH